MQYTQELKRPELVAYFYCDNNGCNSSIHNHSHIGGSDMHFTPIGFSGKEVLGQLVKGSGSPLPIFCGEYQMVLSDVPVKELPKCDIKGCNKEATYDVPTDAGSWGYLCEEHYRLHGKAGGNRLYVIQKKEKKHIEGTPKVRTKYEQDVWGDTTATVKCPNCGQSRNVEPDANYVCECKACKQSFQCISMF
jgi:hypothetical protein